MSGAIECVNTATVIHYSTEKIERVIFEFIILNLESEHITWN